ncbi:MAG: protein kinase [Deltaproteobacteria bacterium]|nr:protein kinase [Deltaproteobacteria bacterium]
MPSVAFGPYEVLARLATGGAANIFLARQPSEDGLYKLVCIKTLLPERAADPEFVDMFLDEARIASRLTHPTCVRIFDLGFERGTYYQSMEFILGETLWNLLATVARLRVALPAPVVASIVASSSEGLHHAHDLADDEGRPYQLVHRDVSPQNLMVTFDGHTKVLDFGVAKAETGREATATGIVKGKFSYMSPEQITGGTIDRRSDIYSLGIVLFECLASRRLYRADSPEEIARMMIERSPPRLRDLVPDVHPRLDAITHKALARLPEHRFQSAQEMALALRDFLDEVGFKTPRAAIRQLTRERFGDRIEAAREICEQASLGDFDESRMMSVFKARAVMAIDLFPKDTGSTGGNAVAIPPLGRAPKAGLRRPSTTVQLTGEESKKVRKEIAEVAYDDATDMAQRIPATLAAVEETPDWESDVSTDGTGSLGSDPSLLELAASVEVSGPTKRNKNGKDALEPSAHRPSTALRLEEPPPFAPPEVAPKPPDSDRGRVKRAETKALRPDPTKRNGRSAPRQTEASIDAFGEDSGAEGTETENSGVQLEALESAFREAFGDDPLAAETVHPDVTVPSLSTADQQRPPEAPKPSEPPSAEPPPQGPGKESLVRGLRSVGPSSSESRRPSPREAPSHEAADDGGPLRAHAPSDPERPPRSRSRPESLPTKPRRHPNLKSPPPEEPALDERLGELAPPEPSKGELPLPTRTESELPPFRSPQLHEPLRESALAELSQITIPPVITSRSEPDSFGDARTLSPELHEDQGPALDVLAREIVTDDGERPGFVGGSRELSSISLPVPLKPASVEIEGSDEETYSLKVVIVGFVLGSVFGGLVASIYWYFIGS